MVTATRHRQILPLASPGPVPPGVRTRIAGKATIAATTFEQFMLSAQSSPGGGRDWIVNDIEIDGRSQLAMKDLSGVLFSSGLTTSRRAIASLHFTDLDVIELDREVAVTVTYVGPYPDGARFFGAIIGHEPPQRPTILPLMTVPLRERTTISVVLDSPLKLERLEIASGSDGADWNVHDIRIDGNSQFVQQGSVPGAVFSSEARDTFVNFAAGRFIEIDVEYVGSHPAECPFIAHVIGTVVRDDYHQPPPDVHAVVRVSGREGLDTAILGTCDWRSARTAEPPSAS